MATASSLGVWLDGARVANLEQPRRPQIRLRYDEEALERWPQNSPVISCSLPLTRAPADSFAFCVGLLPEGQALATVAAVLKRIQISDDAENLDPDESADPTAPMSPRRSVSYDEQARTDSSAAVMPTVRTAVIAATSLPSGHCADT